jgi:hypothetical protein
MDARATGLGLTSIQEINALPREMAEALYLRLVPGELLRRLEISPSTLCRPDGARLIRVTAPEERPWARVEVRAAPGDHDPMLLVDVEMSAMSVPELAFVQINDPTAPRYGIDRDGGGRDTLFGTASRNLDEEARAMRDGLAPGQVRRGLGMLARVLQCMETFCGIIGKDLYLIDPLFYHSAILYERRGCGYIMGREIMEGIHDQFSQTGTLTRGLDGATPFRAPGSGLTVRGRSWALHDGVAGHAWGGVKMYKATSRHAGVNTFPGGLY